MLMIGDWCIDQSQRQATRQDSQATLTLSPEMVALLRCLARNQHRLTSADTLRQQCRHAEDDSSQQALADTIERLCNRLGNQIIEKYGDDHYLLNAPVFQYSYKPVTPEEVREEALKLLEHESATARRVQAIQAHRQEQSDQSQGGSTLGNPLVKGILVAVGIAVLVFIARG